MLYSIFRNSICCKYDKPDAERMEAMVEREQSIVDELKSLQLAAKHKHVQELPEADSDRWIGLYVRWVTDKLWAEVTTGLQSTAEYKEHLTAQNRVIVHASQCRAALLHQEVKLIIQGVDVPTIAVEYGESIGGGCW